MEKPYRITKDIDIPYGSVAKDRDGSYVSEEVLLGFDAERPFLISTDLGNGTPFRFMSKRRDRFIYIQRGTGLRLTVYRDRTEAPPRVGLFG